MKICFHADFQLRSFCYAKTPAKAFYTAASMPPKARNERMKVNGCDCSIVIKTTHHEFDMQAAEGGGVQSYSIHTPPEEFVEKASFPKKR